MDQVTINIANTVSVYLETYFDDQILSNASGFFAKLANSPLCLITNWHVVAGRNNVTNQVLHSEKGIPNKLRVYFHLRGLTGVWQSLDIDLLGDHDEVLWVEHPQFGKAVDVVSIPFNQPPNSFCPSYAPQLNYGSYHLGVAEKVSIVGFPFGMKVAQSIYQYDVQIPIWTTGFVSSEPDVDISNLPLFYVDCRAREGQSGSPVIGSRDALVHSNEINEKQSIVGQSYKLWGVYSGRIHSQSDIGRVWKNSAIIEILNSISID